MKKRILIIDDDAESIELLKEDIEKYGTYEIFEETQGLKAMAAVHKYRPDLVLLDVMIPDLDGPSIARQIELEFQYTIRILFISSIVDFDKENRAAVGRHPFIPKSTSPEEIKVILDKIFGL